MVGFRGARPRVAADAWAAPGAFLVGDVALLERSSVWYGAVLRADLEGIVVGAGSNVQDGAVLHADPGLPVRLGAGVSVGHRAVVHGCTVGAGSLVGMGAVVLNGADIGEGSLIAAGAVVLEGSVVPPGSLVAGVPGKVRRPLTREERQALVHNATVYDDLRAQYATAAVDSR